MEDIILMDAVERYLTGKMNMQEKDYFENLRNTNQHIDQMVVEHDLFLHYMENYANTLDFKHTLNAAHDSLVAKGDIFEGADTSTKGKVVRLFNKYKRVTAIAASVAAFIALTIGLLIPGKVNDNTLTDLNRKIDQVAEKQITTENKIDAVASNIPATTEERITFTNGGTGFLIDVKGYLVTNSHVVTGSSAKVVNSKGKELNAVIVYKDSKSDLAILKIEDNDYKAPASLPYSLKNSSTELGDEIFTLGYPKNEVRYNMGYTSSRTGFDGDTATFELAITANHGNSGGPVLNKNGEVIGVISKSQNNAQGVVFAIKTKNIYRLIDEIKKSDTTVNRIKPTTSQTLKGLNRSEQIKKLEDYVYMVKAYNR